MEYTQHIVQFGWGLYTEIRECKLVNYIIIKSNGWTMGGDVGYHNVTQERATTDGVDMVEALTKYQYDVEQHCCKRVRRNVDVDTQVLQREFIRVNLI